MHLELLVRRKWWVVGALVLLVTVALLYARVSATRIFEATAVIQLRWPSTDSMFFAGPLDLRPDSGTASGILKSAALAAMVKRDLKSPRSIDSLLAMISVRNMRVDRLAVTAVSTDATEAAAVANSFADQLLVYRATRLRQELAKAKQHLTGQLASARPDDEERSKLREILGQLGGRELESPVAYKIMQRATVPSAPARR